MTQKPQSKEEKMFTALEGHSEELRLKAETVQGEEEMGKIQLTQNLRTEGNGSLNKSNPLETTTQLDPKDLVS